MTKDADPTVTNDQKEPSGSRTAQNHGSRKNGTSGVPSAPPGVFNQSRATSRPCGLAQLPR